VLDRFDGGIWFCDLTEAWTPEAICAAVAGAFSVPLPTGADPVDAVNSILEFRKPLALIFDNFEQVVQFAPTTLGRWLTRLPHVSMLVTSRTTLGIAGEHEYRLEPFSVPPIDGQESGDKLQSYDVVRLFVERARDAGAGFELNASSTLDIARICHELDGMPLAIELAAARVRVMSPAQIVDRLDQKFKLLRSMRRDLPTRQQTLAGAIDWSYELLSEWERDALCQACIFHGGFFIEAAEQIIDLSSHTDAPPTLDAVESLRNHSLLATTQTPHGTRLRMYVPIREYAEAKLDNRLAQPQIRELEQRHATYFVQYAQTWDERRGSIDAVEAFDRIELEAENLFAVEDRALVAGDSATAAQSILALATTMAVRGLSAQRLPRLERALQVIERDSHAQPILHARLLAALCRACQDYGQWERASTYADRCMSLTEEYSLDGIERGDALIQRAEMHRLYGQVDSALAHFEQAASYCAAANHDAACARAIGGMGSVLWKMGQYEQALCRFDEAVDRFKRIGHRAGTARNISGRGIVLVELHRYDEAIACYEQAEQIFQELGNRVQHAQTTSNRAFALEQRGDNDRALVCLDQAESINREIGNKANLARNIGIRGEVYERQTKYDDALGCFEQAQLMNKELGNRSGVASNIARRGRALMGMGRAAEAAGAFNEAISIFREISEGQTREAFECLAGMAHALSSAQDRSGVAQAAHEALDIAHNTGLLLAVGDEALEKRITLLRELAGK